MKIGNKTIGEEVFIIAEAGVNHNGELSIAKELIDKAAEAKVDAVKFQTFQAEKLVTTTAKQAEYQAKNIGYNESQFDMLKRLELKKEYHLILKNYAEDRGLIFLSTPFDEDAIDFLDELGVYAFKVGSSDTNNISYLIKMAKKGKPIILSTGMSDLEEIIESVDTILKYNKDLVVLHCTTDYPCPYDKVDLNVLDTLKKELDVVVGYSDHTSGIEIPIAAVSLGAKVIEKHFTLDRNMEGPDHKASLEPNELKAMVKCIRNIEKSLGNKEKIITDVAKKYIDVAKKSIVAKVDILKDTIITKDMLIIKRPGTGIKPRELNNIIGKKITTSEIKIPCIILPIILIIGSSPWRLK